MLRVLTEQIGAVKRLAEIPNGTFFNGCINGYISAGPFLKVGSISANIWVVVKLEAMEGGVFVSSRDHNVTVKNYQALDIKQVVLRDYIGEPKAADAVARPDGVSAA